MKSDKRHREEARQFMRNATDTQLENIVSDERERARRGGEVGRVARIMLQEAMKEQDRRNDYGEREDIQPGDYRYYRQT